MIDELIIGFGMMFESWFRAIKLHLLWLTFVAVFALLVSHFFVNYHAKRIKAKRLVSLLMTFLLASLCIFGTIRYYGLYTKGHKLTADSVPVDLKTHHMEALRDELYASFESDTAATDLWYNGIPPAWTPPVYAFLRWSDNVMGGSFELYRANYKKLGLVMMSAILTLLVGCAFIDLKEKSTLEMTIIALSISILFLLMSFTSDLYLGNSNIFVAFCVAIQVFLTRWENRCSILLQGFFLALAWWWKPTISLVLLSLCVFSLHRKQYAYLGGIIAGVVIPALASLFLSNISFRTYITFFLKISRGIEVNALDHPANLSIFNLFSNPVLAYKVALLLMSLFLILYITKSKGDKFFRYEVLSFCLTFLVWTSLWVNYLMPLSIVLWGHMIIKIREKQTVYFLSSVILMLVWMAYAEFSMIGVNFTLLLCAVYIFLDQVGYATIPGLAVRNESA